MTLLTRVSIVAYAATVAGLVAIAVTDGDARPEVFASIASCALFPIAAVRRRRREYADDPVQPSSWSLFQEASADGAHTVLGMGVFLLAMVVGGEDSGPVFATVASVALTAGSAFGLRKAFRREGVEREVFYRSTSIAFFVTVFGAGAYAVFEGAAGAPRQPMWAVWSVALVVWVVTTMVLIRKAT